MRRTALALALATLAALAALPEAPAFGQEYAYRSSSSRRKSRSTWAPVQRPRRTWQEDRNGLYVGAGILGDFIGQGDTDLSQVIKAGGGFDVFLGMRLSDWLALEVGGLMSIHGTDADLAGYDQALLNALTLDGKFYVMPNSLRLEPFVQLGGGAYMVQEKGYKGKEMGGGGVHAGGGIELRITRALVVGGRAMWKGIWMDNGTEIEPATTSIYHNHATLEANIQIHF